MPGRDDWGVGSINYVKEQKFQYLGFEFGYIYNKVHSHSGSLPNSNANRFGMVCLALIAAWRDAFWLFNWRLRPTVTSPLSCEAKVKKDGPYVRVDGASPGLATV